MRPCVPDAVLTAMLEEDAPFGDLTTRALGIGALPGTLDMAARGGMCLCGSEEAARLFELAGARILECLPSGSRLAAGTRFLRAQGDVEALHLAWKTAQTLVEYLSGFASGAAAIVDALRNAGFSQPLACTRKNFPGNRRLAAKAVAAGGAVAHRLGLSETLLVFPDHRVFVDKATLAERFATIRRQYPEKKLVAEAGDADEALWLATCGADIIQLERFSPEALQACRERFAGQGLGAQLAPAGGVTLANALAYAAAGADFLISSAPYFSPPRDVKVTFLSH
ncbi:MAG: ModD protein [Candidatus Dactylopiibacterium carminicum]|uniref:Putative pyrophosphorylase ModD n=1 Tax=Candidatus Dactylopiibacterium carminicum TaxID=857335 RepID=A0A272EY28_9RHOO|nr:ModD protein [Candidatus Dactylopiibacterium carminicum]KAF7600406.1 ModD protein [Candidatus Dactylopiibacterium carminicum]PAS95027.1 MAG: ModD protein [Candidatus Dactylopiibacterium carminicum]PAS97864.1 MAG: ModD protein [Candidatus Dactylopiibacterium carminicum]PAT00407.1 MAG: ModD protein [Candidatus Dactylopiibacterium carminicum]